MFLGYSVCKVHRPCCIHELNKDTHIYRHAYVVQWVIPESQGGGLVLLHVQWLFIE